MTSGELPLIHIHASCWVAGARCPSVPTTSMNGSSDAGASFGATSRQASAPNPSTRLTPPADTSGVRSRRNEATASVALHARP